MVNADFTMTEGLEGCSRFRRQMEEARPEADQAECQAPNVDGETFVPLSGHRFHDGAAQRLCG